MILLVMFMTTLIIVSVMSSFSAVDIVFPCGVIVIYMIVNCLIILYCVVNQEPDHNHAS